jgi:glutathione S-transferase
MVPLLLLEDDTWLTENIVIAQYLCERFGRDDLLPAVGTMERYRVLEWQSFTAAELHKSFVPLRWPLDERARRCAGADRGPSCAGRARSCWPFLTGATFTAADAYFFVIASWTRYFKISWRPFPASPRCFALSAGGLQSRRPSGPKGRALSRSTRPSLCLRFRARLACPKSGVTQPPGEVRSGHASVRYGAA